LAILGCLFSFVVLAFYELSNNPLTLIMLTAVVIFSFAFEWLYWKISRRKLKIREKT